MGLQRERKKDRDRVYVFHEGLFNNKVHPLEQFVCLFSLYLPRWSQQQDQQLVSVIGPFSCASSVHVSNIVFQVFMLNLRRKVATFLHLSLFLFRSLSSYAPRIKK